VDRFRNTSARFEFFANPHPNVLAHAKSYHRIPGTSRMTHLVSPSILGSMLPALDLENCDNAHVGTPYAIPALAPRAGVLADVARPLAFGGGLLSYCLSSPVQSSHFQDYGGGKGLRCSFLGFGSFSFQSPLSQHPRR